MIDCVKNCKNDFLLINKKIRAYLSEGQGIMMYVVRKALPAGLGKERERER
jgi:hypothetical protein